MSAEPLKHSEAMRGELRSESDFGIVRMMADRDEAWAVAAFQEFYDRHKHYLYSKAVEVCANLGCDAWVEDAMHETFGRAFRKAAMFKFPTCPPKEEDNVVKGWLGAIATHWICDRRRKSKLEDTKSEEQWEQLTGSSSVAPGGESESFEPTPAKIEEWRLLDEAIESLTEREAQILRVTAQYHRLGQKFQRLPVDVVDELAESFNTTPENLRKIRERARKKVRQYVDARRGTISL